MKVKKGILLITIPVVLAAAALFFILVNLLSPGQKIITGIVESTEIDVSSKIPGRVDSVFVSEGDTVARGQLLASLESREIDAKVEQARGAVEAARAQYNMAQAGARPEEKEAVEKLYRQARHQYEFAQKTFERMKAVYEDSVISRQEMDEVEFKYNAAKEQMEAARAKYNMVMKGARIEEITAAEGLYHQAQNALNEALAYQEETRMISPIAGEAGKRLVDPGEIVAAGYPVFTVLDLSDIWIVLQIREDEMTGIEKGIVLKARIPALGKERYDFNVAYIAPMADFATWKATSQKGDFDLKTFEIHLRPEKQIGRLRPGMTARVEMP